MTSKQKDHYETIKFGRLQFMYIVLYERVHAVARCTENLLLILSEMLGIHVINIHCVSCLRVSM